MDIDWTKIDTQVRHEGKQITLPALPGPMDYDVAIETLERVKQQENQTFDVVELVAGAPWDTLVAVTRAMQQIYGVVLAVSQQSFFGEVRPDFVSVKTGPGDLDVIQVPMGKMLLPGVKDAVYVGLNPAGTQISGTVRKADRAILVEIANLARKLLREQSVYRGRAIRLSVDSAGDLELGRQPEFLDLSSVTEADMIHTAATQSQIDVNLLAPLKHTASCRKHGIPLKRGILLEGKYGTGKSLTARVTAKVAIDNGWTFIMLDRSQGLRAAIEFAKAYQPCVIFAEDIDRSADREDEHVNDLVNMLDGVLTKSMEMVVCLTTNFIEKIDRALLRPGRFDAIISIDTPDAETAQRIVRSYARGLLPISEDLTEVGEQIAGMIPASIREVVERAKLSMLQEDRAEINARDLTIAATGMQRHMALLNPVVVEQSAAEKFADGLVEVIGERIAEALDLDVMDADTTRGHFANVVGGLSRIVGQGREIHNTTKSVADSAEKARKGVEHLVETLT